MQQIADGAALSYGDPERLVIFLSSRGAYRKGVFDGTDFSRDMPYTKLYLRDEGKDYFYHNGIPGLTTDMQENAEFLTYFIGKLQPRRVTMVGVSLGAFGALAMGHMVGVDDIHTVSLVSYLHRDIGGDPEKGELWAGVFDPVNELFETRGFDRRYLDGRAIMAEHPGKVRVMRQHVARAEPVDMNHAARISDLPGVQTVVHDRGRHMTLSAVLIRGGSFVADIAAPLHELAARSDPGADPGADPLAAAPLQASA